MEDATTPDPENIQDAAQEEAPKRQSFTSYVDDPLHDEETRVNQNDTNVEVECDKDSRREVPDILAPEPPIDSPADITETLGPCVEDDKQSSVSASEEPPVLYEEATKDVPSSIKLHRSQSERKPQEKKSRSPFTKRSLNLGRFLPGRRARSVGADENPSEAGDAEVEAHADSGEMPRNFTEREMSVEGSSSERSGSESPVPEATEDINEAEALTQFERTAIFGRPLSSEAFSEDSVSIDDRSITTRGSEMATKGAEMATSTLNATFQFVVGILLLGYGMIAQAVLSAYQRLKRLLGYADTKEEAIGSVTIQEPGADEKRATRIYHICHELLSTEEAYVERLGLIVKAKEKATKVLNAEIARDMFKDIEVIHQFHRDNLLPQLRDRMASWSEKQHVGDIMKKLAPFLKLYTEYVKDYQKASNLVDRYEKSSSAFAAALRDIKENQGPRHGKLTLQAHMMEPIQRVPRYELLLRDYIKRIPNDSPDKDDAQRALQCVSEAAEHFENMMKRDSRICLLMGIQARLDGPISVVDNTSREFVKEGRIQRVMPGGHGRLSNKYAFLFNDMLLICNKQKLIVGKYKVRAVLNLAELENVFESRNIEYPFTFYLKCIEEDFELCGYTQDESREWVDTLTRTLSKFRNMETTVTGLGDLITMSQDDCSHVRKGNLLLSDDEAKTWRKRWFVLHKSGVLFCYKSQQESQFCGSLNCRSFIKYKLNVMSKKGLALELQWEVRDELKYYLYDESEEELDRWLNTMNQIEESKKTV